jgi:Streptomycin adenylyltransferase
MYSQETYQTAINDFFSDAPFVAKCLWRDELLPAKWCLDFDMKHLDLHRMLEWRMERDHGWSMPAGNLGKGLKKRLPRQIWSQLEETLTGAAPVLDSTGWASPWERGCLAPPRGMPGERRAPKMGALPGTYLRT